MKEIKFINCTPHEINLYNPDTEQYDAIEPSGLVPRVEQHIKTIGRIGDYTLTENTYGEVVDLPESQPNTYYIVSQLTKQAAPYRKDLVAVNETVRDDKGRIIGAKSLTM